MRRLRFLGRLARNRRLVALLVTSGLVLGFLQLLNTSVVLSNDSRDRQSLIYDGFSLGNDKHVSILQRNKSLALEAATTGVRGNVSTKQIMADSPGPPQQPARLSPAEQHGEPPGDSQEEGEKTMFNAMPAVPGLGLTPAMVEALQSARVLGNPRHDASNRLLTVGIPTVKRERATYLYETLDSLLAAIPEQEEHDIVVLVFVADLDASYNQEVITKLAEKYDKQLDSGLMQVITNSKSMYPDLSPTRRTFNDSRDRVFWRCKQNIDTAFLFSYAANLSSYYIHIEDDVITARSFISDIKRFVQFQKSPWVMLEFGSLGFIGKLFHARDLPKLAACLIVFYQEQPVDLLVPYFIQIMTQAERTYAPYSLFQHIGLHSSLKNKKQPLADKRFKKSMTKRVTRTFKVVNPEAVVSSNMQPYEDSRPMDVYMDESYVFWAADIRKGHYLKAVFAEPQTVTGVAVITSAVFAPADKIYNATLRYGTSAQQCESNGSDLQVAKAFEDGSVLWRLPQPLLLSCIDVFVEEDQKYWALFSELDVFTGNYTLPPPTAQSTIATVNSTSNVIMKGTV